MNWIGPIDLVDRSVHLYSLGVFYAAGIVAHTL